jgi:hypothetical protein
MEFLLRRTDGEWFDLRREQFGEVLKPSSCASRVVAGWGDHRIEINGVQVAFSFEDPGIQVSFDGRIDAATASQIVGEILASVETKTGQRGIVVPL